MKTFMHRTSFTMALAVVLSTATVTRAHAQDAERLKPVEVRGGTASFDVDTNLPVLSVHGKSSALEGRVQIRQGPDGPLLEKIDATLPVKTLVTGLKRRDEHMQKYVFETSDGQLPDMRFIADKAACAKVSGNQSTCQLAGTLSIRGTARPFTIALKVTENGGSFHALGESVVKLSAYGIERPSQLGVSVADDVKLKLDFTARPSAVGTTGVVK
jgi:polyisoprenoid-binding protein YceI